MKLLAVETATEACSVALSINGDISERFALAPKEHTQLILPMIDGLLSEAGLTPSDLDGLAFGCGPGSFTGVRIATGVIQGIAFGLDLPVMPVSTLAAMAQHYFDHHADNLAFVALDARMGEIFWGVYQRDAHGYAELIGTEAVTLAQHVEFPKQCGVGIGSGWRVYQAQLMTRLADYVTHCQTDTLPCAVAVARLGAHGFKQGLAVTVDAAMPVYLRDNVAKKESERGEKVVMDKGNA